MENCLVKKLKAIVDNNKLNYFDSISFDVVKSELNNLNNKIFFQYLKNDASDKAPVIKSFGDSFLVDNVEYTEYELPVSQSGLYFMTTIQLKNNNYRIVVIGGKERLYNFNNLIGYNASTAFNNTFKVDVSQFNYTSLASLLLSSKNKAYGTLSKKISGNVTNINVTKEAMDNTLKIDINSYAETTDITNFQVSNTASFGNIENLANNINLTNMTAYNCSEVIGSLDTFAANQVAAGRTSGTIKCLLTGTNINCSAKVPGSTYDSYTITFDSSLPDGYNISINQ